MDQRHHTLLKFGSTEIERETTTTTTDNLVQEAQRAATHERNSGVNQPDHRNEETRLQ